MDSLAKFVETLQLHPIADHFTVSLLIVAVLIDLVASAAPARLWLRYTALTLMILGALAAGASYATGDLEADRIWNALGQPARDVLHRHAELGEFLAVGFGVLALWRILLEAFGFMAGTRWLYLIIAVVGICTLGYSAHLGGDLVYDYGAGTALMAAAPVPSEAASPEAAPTSAGPLPTVTVPTAEPMSSPAASAPPAAAASASAEESKAASVPTANPTAQPSGAATSGVSM